MVLEHLTQLEIPEATLPFRLSLQTVEVVAQEIVLRLLVLVAGLEVAAAAQSQGQQAALAIRQPHLYHKAIAEEQAAAQIHTEVAVAVAHLLVVQAGQVAEMVEQVQPHQFLEVQ